MVCFSELRDGNDPPTKPVGDITTAETCAVVGSVGTTRRWSRAYKGNLGGVYRPKALSFPGPIKFDDKGRRVDVPIIFAQWQKSLPVTVYPTNLALAKPYWLSA